MSEANTTVLVADDDSTIRRNLVRLLQSEGYQTLEAADGDEALAGVQAKQSRRRAPGPEDARPRWPGGARRAAAVAGRPAGDRRHRTGRLGGGDRGDATRGLRLPDQAVRPRRGAADPEAGLEAACPGHRSQGPASADEAERRRDSGRMRRRRARADRPECRDARGLQGDRPGGRDRRPGPDRRRERNRQGAGRRRAPSPLDRAPPAPSSGSTAGRCPRAWSRASCSATRRAPSPEPTARSPAGSSVPPAAPSSSTRSASCRSRPRPRSSASFSSGSSSASGGPRHSAPTLASSRPRTATCPERSPPVGFAKTCSTASTSRGSSSRRSATAPRISPPWPSTSCDGSSGGTAGASCRSPPRPCRRFGNDPGRATSANWRTPWRGPRSPRGAGPSCPNTSMPTIRHNAALTRGGSPWRAVAAACLAGRGRAARDRECLAGLRRQPHQDRRTPRHQPPPALRQDPRVRPWHVSAPAGNRSARMLRANDLAGCVRFLEVVPNPVELAQEFASGDD